MDPKPRRLQGDEGALFAEHHERLLAQVSRAVDTSREVVEDACAFAWWKLMTAQPDRNLEWRGWLFRTAQREAWRLDKLARANARLNGRADQPDGVLADVVDDRDVHATRLAVDEVMQVLEELPVRLRRVALLRAAGFRYAEIGAITGDSPTRVNQLVARSHERIRQSAARLAESQLELPPRARRLRELERTPPRWLTAEIGTPPKGRDRRVGQATRLLLWRRAALLIDDYRAVSGVTAPDRGLVDRPADSAAARSFDLARCAIDVLQADRELGRDLR